MGTSTEAPLEFELLLLLLPEGIAELETALALLLLLLLLLLPVLWLDWLWLDELLEIEAVPPAEL